MNEEEYKELKQVLENGRLVEIKKLKKESLIDFINETEKRIQQRELEIMDELEDARLCVENFEGTQEVIKEYQDFIEELKTINNKTQEKSCNLEKELEDCKGSKNKIIVINIIVIVILIIILTIAL